MTSLFQISVFYINTEYGSIYLYYHCHDKCADSNELDNLTLHKIFNDVTTYEMIVAHKVIAFDCSNSFENCPPAI